MWLAALMDSRDGDIIVPNELSVSAEEAARVAIDELSYFPDEERENFTIHVIQVVLDRDTPGRWADDVLRKVEALGATGKRERKIIDAVEDIVRDYQPTSTHELGEGAGVDIYETIEAAPEKKP